MGGTIVKIKDVAEKAEKSVPPLALELLSMWAIAQAFSSYKQGRYRNWAHSLPSAKRPLAKAAQEIGDWSIPTGVSGPPVTGIGIKKMSQKVNSKGFRLGEKTRFVAGTVAPGFQT